MTLTRVHDTFDETNEYTHVWSFRRERGKKEKLGQSEKSRKRRD